ncbi:SMI1/KNR4 family protein, partial [Acinetobacter baumannii]|uniref:SMI1/KNR4 family protein n=1 Tax=Acinetobacter baumannii TaxID=470 RepID=UPI0033188BDC
MKLPVSYIALMQQNGGELVNKRLEIGEEVVCVDYLNGIGSKSGEGILLRSSLKREWGLSNKFVYLYGDGHTWLALDYR